MVWTMMTVTRSAVLLRALLGVTVIMIMTILKLAFLATTAIAAPAADAEADPFYGLAYAHPAPIVHALPICKAVPKTVVVGKRCHAEPECTTKSVVVSHPGHHSWPHNHSSCCPGALFWSRGCRAGTWPSSSEGRSFPRCCSFWGQVKKKLL